jgi:hypothetical protein
VFIYFIWWEWVLSSKSSLLRIIIWFFVYFLLLFLFVAERIVVVGVYRVIRLYFSCTALYTYININLPTYLCRPAHNDIGCVAEGLSLDVWGVARGNLEIVQQLPHSCCVWLYNLATWPKCSCGLGSGHWWVSYDLAMFDIDLVHVYCVYSTCMLVNR